MMKYFFIFLFLSACGSAPDTPDLQDAASVSERYAAAVQRLDAMLDNGWVVARDRDGVAHDQGDSLIFSGIAMASLPCDHATPLKREFPDGKLFRHPSLPNEVSLDGALGYYFGIASRISRCRDEGWKDVFAGNGDYVPPQFTFVRDTLAWRLGARGEPESSRRTVLEIEIASWAQAVKASKSACYRVHLGWLALRTLELLDNGPSENGKAAFCRAADGVDLPVVDNWCGRGNLVQWVNDFQFNQWGYRHQRCPGWEYEDGGGLEQPGVDYLLGIREAYKL